MKTECLLPGLSVGINHNEENALLSFSTPVQTLSSALYNGGRQRVSHVLNMKVHHNKSDEYEGYEHPHISLENRACELGVTGPFAGMMTSASMKSFRYKTIIEDDLGVFCCLTAGLTNARAAGDPADFRDLQAHRAGSGTINIVAGTNAALSEAALAEALMIVTEARCSSVMKHAVLSKVSGSTATGTGTDSNLVFSGSGPEIHFCGKHTLLGEMLARAVIEPMDEVIRIIQQMEKDGLI
ncbi:MAG: adenosylcobinamide amidohydrolase [Spirochaetales bacterium]|nr:adenosylcobinamide amidohydrolase [Spirochaetales bacterium]